MSDLYCNGQDPKSPEISTLYSSVKDLPPILFHVAGDEILLDDSIRMADKLRSHGCEVDIKIWADLWHVFQLFVPALPEAEQSLSLH